MARHIVSSRVGQKHPSPADTWQAERRADGAWARRKLGQGWRVEHRVVRAAGAIVVAETRVRPSDERAIPLGGIDSALLRLGLLQGLREAVESLLPTKPPIEDLRGYDGLTTSVKRSGEPRRWDLAVTAYAYVEALKSGSKRPNEDVADALGISVKSVTDRLYHARRLQPPLLTATGRRGMTSGAQLTDAGWEALNHRLHRLVFSLGPPPGGSPSLFIGGTGAEIGSAAVFLLRDAEQRIPGIWDMDVDEVRRRGAATRPPWADELMTAGEVTLEFIRDQRPDRPARRTSP